MTHRPRMLAALAVVGLAVVGAVGVPSPAHAETVRDLQWHLDELDLRDAHDITRGSGVVVAVVDSGVDATAPDLRGRVLPGVGLNGAPADGRTDSDVKKGGHGTGMAGVIAGRGGGEMRLLGVAPDAKILPVSLGPSNFNVDRGIRAAADRGAKVINLSLGASRTLDRDIEAVRYAIGKGAVVVAATGNTPEGVTAVQSPANIPGVVAVAATDREGNRWSGSAQGPQVALAAPGVKIIQPAKKGASPNGYLLGDGTSAATAIVSGVAALVRAKYPSASVPDVINRMIRTAADKGPAGRDEQYGFGIVDPVAALTEDVPSVKENPLGEPTVAGPAGSAAGSDRSGGLGTSALLALGLVGALLLVLAIAVVVAVVAARRRGPRPAAGPYAGYPPGYPHPPPPRPPGPPPA